MLVVSIVSCPCARFSLLFFLYPLSNIDSIFTSITRLYTSSSIVTLISFVHVYVVVKSFYFSMFQLLLSVHISI